MRLLVSVADAADAAAALAGGADVIDAKDPLSGALGAVTVEVLQEITIAVGARRPVTAAAGDAMDEAAIEQTARAFAAAGAAFVKIGFAGTASASRAAALTAAAVQGAKAGSRGICGVVAVAYADADHATSVTPTDLLTVAVRGGAEGVLLDTANKSGPGLRGLMPPRAIAAWVADAHNAGLLVAVAGKLTAGDLLFALDAGADIAGIRSAACEGGRTGRVSADKVRLLASRCVWPSQWLEAKTPWSGV